MKPLFVFKVATPVIFFILVILLFQSPAHAQKHPSDHVRLGAAINYSTLHIRDNVPDLKKALSYDTGFQLHALRTHLLTSKLSVEYGIKGFLFSYAFDDITSKSRNEDGEDIDNSMIVTYMKGDLRTYYLSVPVNMHFHPFESPLYISAGPHFFYKVGYSNGTLITDVLTPKYHYSYEEEYTVPENSRDFLIAASTGIGMNLGKTIPVNIELNVMHSLTHYLDPDKFIDAWIRGTSLSVSYQLGL